MSSEASSTTVRSANMDCGHLLKTYQASSQEEANKWFAHLPEEFRNKIYGEIYSLAGKPRNVEDNWGQIHVFDELPRLQKAIQRVAFNAFDSLPREQRNYVEGRVYFHAEPTETGDPCWGEHHAKDEDNVKVLLQSLDDCVSVYLTPGLQTILANWAAESAAGENRLAACERIMHFLNDESQDRLDLSQLSLTSLPPIFNKAPFINRMKTLNLGQNLLTALPAELGRCQALQRLDVCNNQLTALPPELGQCQALKGLYVSQNLLTALPPELGRCQALKGLYVFGNQLTALPPELGQCQALQRLYVSYNPLTGIPLELLGLPNTCQIYLEGVALSAAVLGRLRRVCTAPGYNGPRITFSMEHAEQRGLIEERSIEELLQELFAISGTEPKAFPNLLVDEIKKVVDEIKKETLRNWLSRLSGTADFQKGGDFQRVFVGKVLNYLEAAEADEKFRETFFAIIEDATTSCRDRVALSILHVSTAFKLASIPADDIEGLEYLLIKEVWPLQMLEKIAREKVPALLLYDEIEVYLGYPIMLRERLKMPIDIQEMLYFSCSGLTEKDLEEAAKFVEAQQADDDASYRFLIGQEKWIEALKANYPKNFEEIDSKIAAEQEKDDCDYTKVGQMREQMLIALTAKALTPAVEA